MSGWRDYVTCPYNKSHVIRNQNIQSHLPLCKEKHQNTYLLTCRFDCPRLCQEDREFWAETVPESIGSKSKRRRDQIKNRQIQRNHKPRINEPPRNSGSNERAVTMDKKKELWDAEEEEGAWGASIEPWGESVKKNNPRKNFGYNNDYNAVPPPGAMSFRSKSAKKRFQKKQRKQKNAEESDNKTKEREEYVIRFNNPVTVTETDLSRKEVYLHYPTKKVLEPDNVPKGGLGIQPMMLQRICFEAFMRMEYPSSRGRAALSAKQNERKPNQVINEPPKEEASPVNEETSNEENKTIQGPSETASGVSPSEIEEEEVKTTQASDGELNDELYIPKRYKPKKDKKKWLGNQKIPNNPVKLSAVEELSLENRFAKYMISDSDELPLSKTCLYRDTFPPSYFECQDDELFKEGEQWKYQTRKYVDYDISQYLNDDEWPDEKDDQGIDENENKDSI